MQSIRWIDSLRTQTWACLTIIYLRYLLGGAYVYAGWGKALGGRFMPQTPVTLLPGDPLSIGVFFEVLFRTGLWWQSLGAGQVLAGALLLTQRFAALGAVAYLPISVCIFLITLSMAFHGTPVLTGLMLLGNLALLGWSYRQLSPLLLPNRNRSTTVVVDADQLGRPGWWEGIGGLLLLTSLSFGNRTQVMIWLLTCVALGLAGLLGFWWGSRHPARR
ncbi:hypothetical protein GCM10027578_17460 [Spirosoma luteolum]